MNYELRCLSLKMQVGVVGHKILRGKRGELEEPTKEFIEGLKQLEQYLGDKTYFGGDTFGFVDVALIPFYSWFSSYEALGNFKVEAHCPELIAWANRCMQRDSVSKSLAAEKETEEFFSEFTKRGYFS